MSLARASGECGRVVATENLPGCRLARSTLHLLRASQALPTRFSSVIVPVLREPAEERDRGLYRRDQQVESHLLLVPGGPVGIDGRAICRPGEQEQGRGRGRRDQSAAANAGAAVRQGRLHPRPLLDRRDRLRGRDRTGLSRRNALRRGAPAGQPDRQLSAADRRARQAGRGRPPAAWSSSASSSRSGSTRWPKARRPCARHSRRRTRS